MNHPACYLSRLFTSIDLAKQSTLEALQQLLARDDLAGLDVQDIVLLQLPHPGMAAIAFAGADDLVVEHYEYQADIPEDLRVTLESSPLLVSVGVRHLADHNLLLPERHLRLDQAAETVWSPRLGETNTEMLCTEVLKAPAIGMPSPMPEPGVLVCCGIFVTLLMSTEFPELLEHPEDAAGLALLMLERSKAAAARQQQDVAESCQQLALQLHRRIRGSVSLDLRLRLGSALGQEVHDDDAHGQRGGDKKDAGLGPAWFEAQKMRKKTFYPLSRVEHLLQLEAQPPRLSIVVRPTSKIRWGLLSRMREYHWIDVQRAQHGVEPELLVSVYDLLIVGVHRRYHRDYLGHPPLIIPRWRMDGFKALTWEENAPLRPRDLAQHLLHGGRWVGFETATLIEEEDDDGMESLFPEPMTRVLVLDLDVHGDEVVPLEERYRLAQEHLPGAVVFRSSWSGGLHLWYFLPKPIPVAQLEGRVLELLGDELMAFGPKGLEIIPRTKASTNVRLFGGLGSTLLDEKLRPVGIGHKDLLEHVLVRAKEQREQLAYLLEPPTMRASSGKSQEVAPLTWEPQTWMVTTDMLPPPLRNAAVPELIRDGDPGSYHNRLRIAGRALYRMWPHVDGAEQGTQVLAYWLMQEPNRSRSKHLSGPRGLAEGRVRDIARTMQWLWPIHAAQREERGLRPNRKSRDLQDVRLSQEDLAAVDRLTQVYCRHYHCSHLHSAFFREVFSDVARVIRAAVEVDGQNVVRCGQMFWLAPPHGRWRLQKKPMGRLLPNPKYFKNVTAFLEKTGTFKPLPRAHRQTQRYAVNWPPPGLMGRKEDSAKDRPQRSRRRRGKRGRGR